MSAHCLASSQGEAADCTARCRERQLRPASIAIWLRSPDESRLPTPVATA
jgi:hypothetical protein